MYRNNMQRRSCNSCNKCENKNDTNYIDNTCQYVQNVQDIQDSCECGFDEQNDIFPENPMLAQSYVPWQTMEKTFIPSVGLKMGTIFPELVSPYMSGDSAREIEYIKNSNMIGEGYSK